MYFCLSSIMKLIIISLLGLIPLVYTSPLTSNLGETSIVIMGTALQAVVIGDSIELQCPLKIWFPENKFDWYHSLSRLDTDGSSSVQLMKITFNDLGDYWCQVREHAGSVFLIKIQSKPIIVIEPGESEVIKAEIGQNLVLQCEAHGFPKPNVIWHRVYSTSSIIKIPQGEVGDSSYAVHEINYLCPKNIGYYICQARNSMGKAEKRVQIVIDRDSGIRILGISVQYVAIGGSIELHCPLTQKYSKCDIYWKQQNSLLQENYNNHFHHSLLISNISLNNEEYNLVSCSLTNDSQPAYTFEFRIVRISEQNVKITPWESGVVSRRIGDQVTLECRAFGYPKSTVIWHKLSSISPALMPYSQKDTNSSHAIYNITCLSVADRGYYVCQAENPFQKAEKRIQIVIDSDSGMEIPGIVIQYVEMGGSLELHCPLIQKYSECNIYWKQQNSLLQKNHSNYCHQNLLISNISFNNEDYNLVSCSLTNDSQPAYTFEFRIVRISEQNVTITPWESGVVSRRIGDQVTLECRAFGYPKSTVIWHKLSSIPPALMPYSQKDTNSSHAIYNITCLSVADRGYYVCQAENPFQKAEKRIQIVIDSDSGMEIPGIVIQYVEMGGSLELHCPLIQKYSECNIYWKQQNSFLQKNHSNYCHQNLLISNISFNNEDYNLVSCSLTNDSQPAYTFEFRIVRISEQNVTITPWESGVVSRRIGDQVTLECRAFGYPKSTVIWHKLSSIPPALMPYSQKDTNSSHAIYNITCLSAADRGYYVCQAENPFRKAEKRIQIVIDSDSGMEIPGIVIQYVEMGGSLELHCPLIQKYSECNIYWKQQNSLLQKNHSNYCHQNLLISNISFNNEDYNLVSCSLTNDSQPAYTFEFRIVRISEQNVTITPWESGVVSRRIGDQVTLECRAFGYPKSTVIWHKLSSIPPALMPYSQKDTNSSHAIYNITCLSVADRGYYVCQAENPFQKAEKRIQIVIDSDSGMEIPGIVIQYVEMGGSLELHCPLIQKYSECNIYWKQQNSLLQKNHSNYCHQNLLISNISLNNEDYNLVSCSLTNDSQPAYTFEFRIVRISEQNVTITPWESGVVSRRIGDQVTLECRAFGYPKSTVIWHKLSSIPPALMPYSQKDTNSSHAIYNITCLSAADRGYYVCQAENPFQKAEKRIQIVIDSDSGMEIPGIVIQYVEMGGSLELHCPLIQKYSECNIYWKQQNSLLQKNHSNYCHQNLLISNISFNNEDYNLVSCSLTNDSQPAYTFKFLIVRISKPNITIIPHGDGKVYAQQCGMFSLSCTASGHPEPTAIWSNLISESSISYLPPLLNTNSSSIRHEIACLSREHEGSYTCVASNTPGTVTESVQIVIDRSRPGSILKLSATYLEIECGATVEIICQINGCCAADLNLMWVRTGYPSLPSQSTVAAGALKIRNFTFESEGQYSCVGLDSTGVEMYRTTTLLELQPSSVRMWTNHRPEIGEDVSSYCTVCGVHIISVEWHFERDLPCNVEIFGNELHITKYGPGNNGMYTCIVKTIIGSAAQVGFLFSAN